MPVRWLYDTRRVKNVVRFIKMNVMRDAALTHSTLGILPWNLGIEYYETYGYGPRLDLHHAFEPKEAEKSQTVLAFLVNKGLVSNERKRSHLINMAGNVVVREMLASPCWRKVQTMRMAPGKLFVLVPSGKKVALPPAWYPR